MDEKKVIDLAKSIYIKPSKEVINLTLDLYKNVKDGLQDLEEKLSKIDFNSLREDKKDDSFKLELSDILNNASSTKDDYIVTKKAQNED